jgi:anti-anti-sigma factor
LAGEPTECLRRERRRTFNLRLSLLPCGKAYVGSRRNSPSNVRELVIDLAGVTFIDSSAIRALLDARKQAGHNGVRVVARLPDEGQVLEVLRLTGVDQVLDPLDA